MILKHQNVNFLSQGSTVSCDKMLSVKGFLLLKIKKHENHQICAMDLISHQGITLILIGRSVIQLVFGYLTFIFYSMT